MQDMLRQTTYAASHKYNICTAYVIQACKLPHQVADTNAKTNEERGMGEKGCIRAGGIYSLRGKYLQINASSSLQREIYTAIYILINFLLLHYEFPSVSVISARRFSFSIFVFVFVF